MKNKNDDFVSLDLLRKLFQEMKEFKITRLVIQEDDRKYEIEKDVAQKKVASVKKADAKKIETSTPDPEPDAETQEEYFAVKTPIVGTFYRSSSPDSEPFVETGEKVEKGDPLCIIEAMKAVNEIESEVTGIVKDILVDNAQAVEYDQTLFLIEEE
ncbi:MAG: acetyl-CoA carboxylase biotin carboxyl carrier protein [Candidatus Cloacimonetes bacterium]|nr:acetyl-CoA carboxylase biotin carboxyl carrier protein [Candidatus Cloacimonadota bacterium]MBS3767809.1 acetyl-CoA carboxylase biotin carboxyl carrier protein [Candidatus Cloacimonadota bacterium]